RGGDRRPALSPHGRQSQTLGVAGLGQRGGVLGAAKADVRIMLRGIACLTHRDEPTRRHQHH
ncbi:MAG TPA: hypothetical protein VLA67_06505, partial [Nitrospiraceae bacterium]|nr:hypothetical protein [Nitrospiraceae bacterium]